MVGANQMCITECSCFLPATSGYIRHSEHFVDEALGFMMGWCDVYSSLIPNELSAVAVVMQFWTDLNPAVWITVFGLFIVATNSYNIKFYGELEFFFGVLKLCLIVILVVTGLVIDLGGTGERIGFRYWKEDPFIAQFFDGSLGKFVGFWKAISSVVYAYGGVQAISLLAGESQYPRRTIFRSAKRVFYRVFGLYLLTVFVLTLIVSPKNPLIAEGTGTAKSSPFVVAMQGQIKVLPHIINAIVCSSALSAANLQVVKVSRTLFALAAKNQAPKIFLRTNRNKLPYVGVVFACSFIPLAYMSISSGSATVFSWFQNITSSNILMNWCVISVNHIFMSRALKAQGYDRSTLPHRIPGTPFAAWFSLFFSVLFLLTGGFANFIHGNFDFGSFFGAYFIIPLSIILFLFYKIWKKTKLRDPLSVDLKSVYRDIELYPEPPYPKLKGWELLKLLWA